MSTCVIKERHDTITVAGRTFNFVRPKFLHRFTQDSQFYGLLVSVEDETHGPAFVYFEMAILDHIIKGRWFTDEGITAFAAENEETLQKLIDHLRDGMAAPVKRKTKAYGDILVFVVKMPREFRS